MAPPLVVAGSCGYHDEESRLSCPKHTLAIFAPMSIIQIILLAVALSMDAMAVSIGYGTRKQAPSARTLLSLAIGFGLFQALMPLLGYVVGSAGATMLQAVDHWVAFGLLAFVGGKMLWEALHSDDDEDQKEVEDHGHIAWKTLLLLSIATSIDAAAVGLSLSMIHAPILIPALWIGCITFALSWLGGHFGKLLGARMGKAAEVLGGLVLIAIGVKIVIDHWG